MRIFQQNSQCLFRLVIVWIKSVGGKLLDVSLGQSSEFGLPQALGKIQEGLKEENVTNSIRMRQLPPVSTYTDSSNGHRTNLIVLHLPIIYIQLQADCRTCGLDWQH